MKKEEKKEGETSNSKTILYDTVWVNPPPFQRKGKEKFSKRKKRG